MPRFAPIIASLLALAACAPAPRPAPGLPPAPAAQPSAEVRSPVVLLVSIDGFRPDYLHRGNTPNLDALAAAGVSAAMRPSFPSKTFPNHWTLVTGLRPDRTGIVGNRMRDAARPGEVFTMTDDDPFWWNAAEPIWVTAEKAGIRTATGFWPGSNVAWGGTKAREWPHQTSGGTRPADWAQFNQAIDDRQRVDLAIDWLRRPVATRPRFLTLYFDEVDTAGHWYGPDDPRTADAVRRADAAIGRLREGLATLNQPANLVVVADHGMAALSPARVIRLDTFSDPADYDVVEEGVYVSLDPKPGRQAAVETALLGAHGPHLTCYRKSEIPARLHYGRNSRVPAMLCMADVGWTVTARAPERVEGGNHGYDSDAPAMRALFLARGPAFRAGGVLPDFDNVDVAPLLRDLLGLPAGRGLDGDDAPFRGVLRPAGRE